MFVESRGHRCSALLILILLILSGGCLAIGGEIGLPKQMGYINDYGAIFGADRRALQSKIDELKREFSIEMVILISERDPYRDPSLLAENIVKEWGLTGERTLFALYVKQDKEWLIKIGLSPDLESRFAEDINLLKGRMEGKLKEGKVREVVEQTVSSVYTIIKGTHGRDKGDESSAKNSSNLYLLIGAIAVAVLLIGYNIMKRLCPRCGRRMRVRESTPFGIYGGVRHIIYYCPNCGYSKVRKGEG